VRFDDHFLEELKNRLRPSEVIGRTVKLRRNGREWVGLSPFTKEKTPSFYVNDQKRFFHDFSSGKHGDIITFMQETQRLSFNEAVERLASEAGMALPAVTPESRAIEMKRQSLTDWMDLAQKWFMARLQERNPAAQNARDYLERRGLSPEDIARFGLGYAPRDRTALKDALVQRGARVSELVECGLLIEPEGGGAPYDRFRDRLMFPIEDSRGKIVSFGGRALNPDDKAKYLNGPETSLFHKGSLLFGLPGAIRLLGAEVSGADLVVVEGYMDVLACQRANVAAVAPLGTALTEDQIDMLWRRHPEPTLCFDGDKAGQRAASRALDRALPKLKPGRSFKVCLLPGGQDPDDLLREKGALALREALKDTKPFVEVLFAREAELEPLDTPERKAGFKKRLRALAQQIEDKDLADSYRHDLLARYDELVSPPRAAQPFPAYQRPDSRRNYRNDAYIAPAMHESRVAAGQLKGAPDPVAASLAQGLIDNPDWLDDQVEALEAYGLGDDRLEPIARALVTYRFQHETLDRENVSRHLHKQGLGALLSEIQKAALKSGAPFLLPDISSADAHARWLQAFNAMSRLTALERALNSARESVGTEFFSRLKLERDALRRSLRSGQIWQDEGGRA